MIPTSPPINGVIESNEDITELLCGALRDAGFQPVTASTSAVASPHATPGCIRSLRSTHL